MFSYPNPARIKVKFGVNDTANARVALEIDLCE